MNLPYRLERYVLIDLIASGGMAQVYRAKTLGPGGFEKTVAVKMIHPHLSADRDFIDMLIDEAKLTARLTHPNIAQTIDFLEDGNHYFLVMEFIEGNNLRRVLKQGEARGRPLSFPDSAFIAWGAANGLDFAHRRIDEDGEEDRPLGIIHRDVSPQNILVSYEGEVKLVDFGVAKAAGRLSVTQTGVMKGKFAYMSPEQADGQALDHRSDIFSLGVVMYELFTGERLFQGDSDISTLRRVREAKVEPPSELRPEIPKELEAITLRCLARELDQRYPTAGELRDDLQFYLSRSGRYLNPLPLSHYLKELFAEERKKGKKPEEKDLTGLLTGLEPESGKSSSSLIGTTPLLLPASGENDATRKLAGKKSLFFPRAVLAGAAILVLAAGFWAYPRFFRSGSTPAETASLPSVTEPAVPAPLVNPPVPPPVASPPASPEPVRVGSPADTAKNPAPFPLENPNHARGSETKWTPKSPLLLDSFRPAPNPKPIEVVRPQPDVVLPSEDLTPEVKPRTAAKTPFVVTPSKSEVLAPANAPAEPGILALNVLPWAMVFIDGEKKGRNTPIISLELAPGYHSVRIINTELKVDRTIPLEIKPGEATRQIIKLNSD